MASGKPRRHYVLALGGVVYMVCWAMFTMSNSNVENDSPPDLMDAEEANIINFKLLSHALSSHVLIPQSSSSEPVGDRRALPNNSLVDIPNVNSSVSMKEAHQHLNSNSLEPPTSTTLPLRALKKEPLTPKTNVSTMGGIQSDLNKRIENMLENQSPLQISNKSKVVPKTPQPLPVTVPEIAEVPAVKLAIVTYQRTGSTFLGELFNQNPSAFYWFEPLDGLYSALYGTRFGMNVPANLWHGSDGSTRQLPTYEVEAIAHVVRDLLTCQFDNLPTEVLVHSFIKQFLNLHVRLTPYANCSEQKQTKLFHRCASCNKLFEKQSQAELKRGTLKRDEFTNFMVLTLSQSYGWDIGIQASRRGQPQCWNKYQSCMQRCRESATYCLSHLRHACRSSSIRSTKMVRFPMEAVLRLQDFLPDVKVIHNFRDPRAVVHSRLNTSSSFQSNYAHVQSAKKNSIDLVKEANLYCQDLQRHLADFETFEKTHPKSAMRVFFEDFARNPNDTARKIYGFVGTSMPPEIGQWLDVHTTNGSATKSMTTRDSKTVIEKWRKFVPGYIAEKIEAICSDVFKRFGSIW